jgi:Na+/H+-dicarboxylate symporter
VPLDAISLVIPIMTFLDMFETMSNTTGDMAVSTIVASNEKLLDADVYKKGLE